MSADLDRIEADVNAHLWQDTNEVDQDDLMSMIAALRLAREALDEIRTLTHTSRCYQAGASMVCQERCPRYVAKSALSALDAAVSFSPTGGAEDA